MGAVVQTFVFDSECSEQLKVDLIGGEAPVTVHAYVVSVVGIRSIKKVISKLLPFGYDFSDKAILLCQRRYEKASG
jgi:hypothetical protein